MAHTLLKLSGASLLYLLGPAGLSFIAEDKTQGRFRFSTLYARYFTERIARISF